MRRAFGALRVELNEAGHPHMLHFGAKKKNVKRVLDSWLYGGRWWRGEGARTYYLLQLGDGTDVEVYREGNRWLLSRKGD